MEIWYMNYVPHECNTNTESGFCGCAMYIIDDVGYIIENPNDSALQDLISDELKDEHKSNT